MKKIILTSILSVLALLLLAADGKARGGFRGGGFRGGGLRMGSVRHYGNYNRSPERRQDERQAYRGAGYGDPAARHAEVARATVDPAIRRGTARRVAVGATVATLPRGYRRYRWNNAYWYSYQGTWYMDGTQDGTQYVVTDPPVGMTVDALPGPAQHVVVDGQTLYLCQGIYYKAIWTDGHATYTVVQKP